VGAQVRPGVRQPDPPPAARAGDKWHLDEVALKIAGVKHWLWRAVDQTGMVLDVLVQSRRDKRAAKRLLRKLLKRNAGRRASWSRTSWPATARRRRS
jgi:transposase-like protein